MLQRVHISQVLFMVLILASLISGILTGWFRLGFELPVSHVFLDHGAMMTGSFLGTVILIERIVAQGRKWLYVFPLVNASSIVFYYFDLSVVAFYCLIFGAAGLFYVFFRINQMHLDLPHQIMWIGAGCWLIGNVHLLLFRLYAHSILWWMAFLLLTIVGERLELSRFLPLSALKRSALIIFLIVFLVSCTLPFHLGGQVLTGVSLILIASWLLFYDMARKSIKKPGIHQFAAITLICGYVWLAVTGVFYLFNDTGTVTYDALIHSFFLGFIFSMIFAHGPIILPGVLKLTVKPYHRMLYLWVFLFHFSLIIRITGGMLAIPIWKQLGGIMNGVLIILFLVNLIGLVAFKQESKFSINETK